MDIIIGRSARFAGLVLRHGNCYVPKVSLGTVRCLCLCDSRRPNVNVYGINLQWRTTTAQNQFRPDPVLIRTNFQDGLLSLGFNGYSTDASQKPEKEPGEPILPEKQSVFQKMKQMTKDYWYILIPVHLVTSAGWISIFYAAAKNGVDIVSILESINLSERYLDMLRGSSAGHWAVTYALYKIFTPLRYTVTVGGTTMSIRYLNKWGYLKFKPRSTIKETQSSKCATEHKEKYPKESVKDQQETEPPKT